MDHSAPRALGVILPTGIATDDTTKFFFGDLVERRALASLYSFENEEFVFPAVHHAFRFCLLTVAGSALSGPADLVFYARQVDELAEPERHFSLGPDDFALLNPNTRTCPTFRSRRLTPKSPSRCTAACPSSSTSQRATRATRGGSRSCGCSTWPMTAASSSTRRAPDRLPLYEAKMIHQFDHRWSTYVGDTIQTNPVEAHEDPAFEPSPHYWVERRHVDARLAGRWVSDWLLGWRDITGAEKVRTLIASVIPRAAVGDEFLLMLPSHPCPWLLEANLNSFVADWAARQKAGGTHLKYFVMRQIPILPPGKYWTSAPWSNEQ